MRDVEKMKNEATVPKEQKQCVSETTRFCIQFFAYLSGRFVQRQDKCDMFRS